MTGNRPTENSYVCGTADAPLLGDTIGQSLDKAVLRWPNREALVSPSHDVRWTWSQFAERVDALAAGFLALGLERGARIGIWSLNRPEWTEAEMANTGERLTPPDLLERVREVIRRDDG